ncbi:putative membrane protein YGL010W [Bradyrhizobium sp. LB7.2]
MLHETEMASYFQRQLADYVEYHRDPWNCAMHVVGILLLFTGAVLPLTLVHVPLFGIEVSLAVIFALPVLVYWLMLDAGIGLGILASMIVLLSVATAIGNQVSIVMMWSIFAVLIGSGVASQIVGHKVFEERQPSMVDHLPPISCSDRCLSWRNYSLHWASVATLPRFWRLFRPIPFQPDSSRRETSKPLHGSRTGYRWQRLHRTSSRRSAPRPWAAGACSRCACAGDGECRR